MEHNLSVTVTPKVGDTTDFSKLIETLEDAKRKSDELKESMLGLGESTGVKTSISDAISAALHQEWTLNVVASVTKAEWSRDKKVSQKLKDTVAVIDSAEWASGKPRTLDDVIAHIVKTIPSGSLEPIPLTATITGVASLPSIVLRRIGADDGTVTGTKLAKGKLPEDFGFLEEPSEDVVKGRKLAKGQLPGDLGLFAEAGEDEFIISEADVRRGLPHVSRTMSALVSARDGGTLATVENLAGAAVIPASKTDKMLGDMYGSVPHFGFGQPSAVTGAVTGIMSEASDIEGIIAKLLPYREGVTEGDIKALAERIEKAIGNLNSVMKAMDSTLKTIETNVGDVSKLPEYMKKLIEEEVLNGKSFDEAFDKAVQALQKVIDDLEALSDGTKESKELLKALDAKVDEMRKMKEDYRKKMESKGEESLKSSETGSGSGSEAEAGFFSQVFSKWREGSVFAKAEGENREEVYEKRGKVYQALFEKLWSVQGDANKLLLSKTFDVVEKIYDKLKEASPLLQTVETLFNLAMQLFFMPLGNKLAEVLIPSMVDLVEKVTDMWDKLEGKTLGEIFIEMIDYGVTYLRDFFKDIGDKLSGEGDIIANIGVLLNVVGTFLENHGRQLLNTIVDFMSFVIGNFREVISAIVGFKVATLIQHSITRATIAAASTPFVGALMAAGVSAVGGVAAGLGTEAFMNWYMPSSAEGSYVEATPGGQAVQVAEGGEGEFIIPASYMSKVIEGGADRLVSVMHGESVVSAYAGMGDVHSNPLPSSDSPSASVGGGSTTNVTYYINGYTDSELRDIIRDTVNEISVDSRFKGRYW